MKRLAAEGGAIGIYALARALCETLEVTEIGCELKVNGKLICEYPVWKELYKKDKEKITESLKGTLALLGVKV